MITNNTVSYIDKFQFYSEQRHSWLTIPGKLKHILVFGQARQGKSSIINLFLGLDSKNGAPTSSSVVGCTFSTEPYWNDKYCLWDTAGLNEQSEGTVDNSLATKNLIKFIKECRGFHAAAMVVNCTNVNLASTKQNWALFYDSFLQQRIPVMIFITGRGIESADLDQEWINSQKTNFKNLGFTSTHSVPHKCVVYSKENSEISNTLRPVYDALKEQSRNFMETLLKINVKDQYYNPVGESSWFDVLKRVWNTFVSILHMPHLQVTVREAFYHLLVRLGFAEIEAKKNCSRNYIKFFINKFLGYPRE